MRIVAGELKGRRLKSPKDLATRPTTDRLRESLFNILVHMPGLSFEGARVADVFAGTGALGFEALSRGATRVCFVEKSREARALIAENIATLDLGGRTELIAADARTLPAAAMPYDIVFLDPPYGRSLLAPALVALCQNGWCHDATLIIAETANDEALELPDCVRIADQRPMGGSRLFFLYSTL